MTVFRESKSHNPLGLEVGDMLTVHTETQTLSFEFVSYNRTTQLLRFSDDESFGKAEFMELLQESQKYEIVKATQHE